MSKNLRKLLNQYLNKNANRIIFSLDKHRFLLLIKKKIEDSNGLHSK